MADGSQGSPGGASERGETALVHYVRRFLSSGAEAEKIQKYSQADRIVHRKKEKDIEFMNSERDCAESGGDIRKELDSGPVGTRRCLMPVRSHVARFLIGMARSCGTALSNESANVYNINVIKSKT